MNEEAESGNGIADKPHRLRPAMPLDYLAAGMNEEKSRQVGQRKATIDHIEATKVESQK